MSVKRKRRSASECKRDQRGTLAGGAISQELADRRLRLWFGFFIAIGGLALAALAIWTGHSVAGSIIGVGDIAGLATVFVTGRTSQ